MKRAEKSARFISTRKGPLIFLLYSTFAERKTFSHLENTITDRDKQAYFPLQEHRSRLFFNGAGSASRKVSYNASSSVSLNRNFFETLSKNVFIKSWKASNQAISGNSSQIFQNRIPTVRLSFFPLFSRASIMYLAKTTATYAVIAS